MTPRESFLAILEDITHNVGHAARVQALITARVDEALRDHLDCEQKRDESAALTVKLAERQPAAPKVAQGVVEEALSNVCVGQATVVNQLLRIAETLAKLSGGDLGREAPLTAEDLRGPGLGIGGGSGQ